jgi:hypothetical protein
MSLLKLFQDFDLTVNSRVENFSLQYAKKKAQIFDIDPKRQTTEMITNLLFTRVSSFKFANVVVNSKWRAAVFNKFKFVCEFVKLLKTNIFYTNPLKIKSVGKK